MRIPVLRRMLLDNGFKHIDDQVLLIDNKRRGLFVE
jgi:hypothetical protein